MALALPFPAWALDWVSNGSSVNVPTGQTLETSGTGSIVSTSVSGSAADGSRLIDIEQNTDGNEPGDPTGDNSRLYCEEDFHDSGVDACLLYHAGDNNNGDRLLTEDIDEGTLLSQLASSPGDPPGNAYTSLYARDNGNLYIRPEGGSEEQVCTDVDYATCRVDTGIFVCQGDHSFDTTNNYSCMGTSSTATDVEWEPSEAVTVSGFKCKQLGTDSSCSPQLQAAENGTPTGGTCTLAGTTGCSVGSLSIALDGVSDGFTIEATGGSTNCCGSCGVICHVEYTYD